MHSLHFTAETSSDGVLERDFTVGEVTGVLWSSASGSGRAPLVLMGHGGGTHKKWPGMVGRAHRLVTGCGFHVAVIDAPGHGGRPRTEHDEQEIAALFQARAAGEPEGPIVVRYNAHLAERARSTSRASPVSRCSTPSPRRGRRCTPTRASTRSCPGSRPTARSGSSPGTSADRSPRRPDVSGIGVRLASRAPIPRPISSSTATNRGLAADGHPHDSRTPHLAPIMAWLRSR